MEIATKNDIIPESPVASCWYLYLLQNADGMLYTGISTDVARRLRQHNGEIVGGAKALRGKGPFSLVAAVPLADRAEASRYEYLLKRQPKQAKKEFLLGLLQSVRSTNA